MLVWPSHLDNNFLPNQINGNIAKFNTYVHSQFQRDRTMIDRYKLYIRITYTQYIRFWDSLMFACVRVCVCVCVHIRMLIKKIPLHTVLEASNKEFKSHFNQTVEYASIHTMAGYVANCCGLSFFVLLCTYLAHLSFSRSNSSENFDIFQHTNIYIYYTQPLCHTHYTTQRK